MRNLLLSLTLLFSLTAEASVIEAYFNHNQGRSYTDPYYKRTRPGDDLEAVLVSTILSAKTSVDVAVYDFNLPRVAQALAQKYREGVRIRLIFDNDNSQPFLSLTPAEVARLPDHDRSKYQDMVAFSDENRDGQLSPAEITAHDGLTILKEAGITWIDDTADGSRGSSLMHHKFLIVDSSLVVTGSTNFTRSCVHGDFGKPYSKGNANSLLKIASPQLAQLFTEEFEEMWVKKRFGLKKSYRGPRQLVIGGSQIRLQFSPTSPTRGYEASTNGLISQQLEVSQHSAHLALFVFSEQRLADSLKVAFDRGSRPSVLIDPSFAVRDYSELLDLWGLEMRSERCKIEEGNAPWSPALTNSGFTPLEDGDVLHHKFGVLDGNIVIIGSHNWSEAANTQNDEALLMIGSQELGNAYEKEFNFLTAHSVIGPQEWLLKKIAQQNQACAGLRRRRTKQ